MSAPEQEQRALEAETARTEAAETAEADPWNAFRDIPMRVVVDIPLPPMSIRALGVLAPGQVLVSSVPTSDDLPIEIGGALVSWARFECVDGRMAMRITRLA